MTAEGEMIEKDREQHFVLFSTWLKQSTASFCEAAEMMEIPLLRSLERDVCV